VIPLLGPLLAALAPAAPAAAAAIPAAASGIASLASTAIPTALGAAGAGLGALGTGLGAAGASLGSTAALGTGLGAAGAGLGALGTSLAAANIPASAIAAQTMAGAGAASGGMAAPVGTELASAIGGVKNLTKIGSALFKMGSQGAGAEPAPFTPEVRRGQPRDRSGSLGGGMFAGPRAAPSPFPQTSMNQGIMAMQPMGSPFQRPMSSSPMSPVSFNRDGGYIQGPGTGRSDSIPARIYQDGQPVQEARLSDGEFVMTERAVRGAGTGDRAKGAARMYRMMREFEKGGRVHGRA
jgi:hypothetical protein